MKVATVLVVLLALFSGCLCQTKFQADYQVGNLTKPTAGLFPGQFNYDTSANAYLTIEKNTDGSLSQNEVLYDFTKQYQFRSGPGCPGGCETGQLLTSFPKLSLDTSIYTAATTPAQPEADVTGTTDCYRYAPKAGTSSVSTGIRYIWFTSTSASAQVCRVEFTNNMYYLFSNINTNINFPAGTFDSPSGCTCNKPVDISLVLDRSGSISKSEFSTMLSFVKGFYNSFKWDTSRGNLAIVNFNTKAWGTFNTGNSQYTPSPALALTGSSQTILNSINSLTCCNTDPNKASCCDGYTSISAGIRAGIDELRKSTRPSTTKVVLLLTDGKQNTLYNSATNGNDCYSSGNSATNCCQYAVGSGCPDDVYGPNKYPGAQYLRCIGDSNYDGIVDTWQPGFTGAWACGRSNGCPTNQPYPAPCGCPGYPSCCQKSITDKVTLTQRCNGTYCSTDSSYMLKRMDVCHGDLINAREYGYQTLGTDLIYYAVGVGDVSLTELNIVTNNLYQRPSNRSPISPINWTPNYDADDLKSHPERVLSANSWDQLGALLTQLTTKICDEPATPCGDCCGVCACGACVKPTTCAQPTNLCKKASVIAVGGCCVEQDIVCPAKPCQDAICDPAKGCVYTPRKCQASNACYDYTCDVNSNQCIQTQKWTQPANKCQESGCDTNTLTVYTRDKQPTCSSNNDACTTYTCDPNTGNCISAQVTPPAINKCQTRSCDPQDGWSVSAIPCNPQSKCYTAACDTNTGNCIQTARTCIVNATNLCENTACDPNRNTATGCPAAPTYITCPPSNDKCVQNPTCQPSTGKCVSPPRKTCTSTDCRTFFCDAATGNCITTDQTCTGLCANAPCGQISNECFSYKCNPNSATFQSNCEFLNVTNCVKPDDTCVLDVRCVNATGCENIPVADCGTPTNLCNKFIRNSTFPGCCQEVPAVNCDTGDLCFDFTCLPDTGRCNYTAKCQQESTPCVQRGCNKADGSCYETPVICEDKPCFTKTCIDTLSVDNGGGCQYTALDCDDKNACTEDSCNPTSGECVHTPINCNGTDPCIVYSCSIESGCGTAPRVCDDGIACTVDSCDSSAGGCQHVPIDSYCDDNNLCTNDSCSVSDGCVYISVLPTCQPPNQCEDLVCRPGFGCQYDEVLCYLNATDYPVKQINYDLDEYSWMSDTEKTAIKNQQQQNISDAANARTSNGDCSFAVCSNSTCEKRELACGAANLVAILAGALTAGAIAGIAVAAIAFALLAGGGAYFAAQNAGLGSAAAVGVNPLYEPNATSGDNPLHVPGA